MSDAAPVATEQDATAIAQAFLEREPTMRDDVVVTRVVELPTCWVAYYNTRTFLETKSFLHVLGGNWPVIVDRLTGRAYSDGTDPAEDR